MSTLPDRNEGMRQAGFKIEGNGAHISRTMMLAEISRCLELLPVQASRADYQAAIIDRNILGKRTEATRRESFRRLRELYALDPSVPLFRIYRALDRIDSMARPQLSILVACARDPLLRATVPVIVGAREGAALGARDFDEALERNHPGLLKPKIRAATARHIASTWEQAGHLSGKMSKTRTRLTARPVSLVMALAMAGLEGVQGAALFASRWCEILDLNAAQAQSLASQAHREGLIELRAIGTVVEVTFPRFAAIFAAGGPHESL
jgi:hypothetical protein